ncbi:MAG: flagellar filament capping protein FliD, partial [Candidatus Bathyarchaeota archaeon]|nr:flagellar filament capping protein FliD [Candidatus Bathyarchaeota archaeon]
TSTDDEDEEDSTFTEVHGNYGVNIIKQNLKDILASKGLGFMYYDSGTSQGDMFTSLSTIGISTDADEDSTTFGQLIIDEEELTEALKTDPDAVASLFSAEGEGVTYSTDMSFDSIISGVTEPGEYEVSYTVSGGVITSATINGNEASIDGTSIVGSSGNPESGLCVSVTNLTDGVYSDMVYVKQGKINQLIDTLDVITNSDTGILSIIEDNYEEIIDNNAEAILREEARLDSYEQRLIEKFARLEALLGEYEDINTALEDQIDSLDS